MTTAFKLIQALTILLFFSCINNNKEVITTWNDGAIKVERNHSDTPNVYVERKYYENRQLASETRFQNAKQNGKSISFYKDGNLLGVVYYRDGKINGEVLEYHKNGKLLFKGTQENSELTGKAMHYYENGKPKTELFYKDNQRLVINQWDSSGNHLTKTIDN
jgi:antitoxin component YwqK of YwqJK toxin-antitoxin module